jgi:glycine oxidase
MADVLIVGGGVIGLSIAWRAAQQGFDVVVADPDPGGGASHAAAGMLTPVSEAAYTEKELFGLAAASLRRYPAFAAELTAATGQPTGFRLTGTLQVGYDHDDLAVIDELRDLHDSLGVPGQRLTGRECRQLEPMLDPAVRGGLLAEADGSVDPRLLVGALLAAVGQAGVRLIRQAVVRLDGRTVVLGDGSTAEADRVVLAAGWGSANIEGLPPGAVPPVRPVKGQILRLRSPGGFLNRSVRGLVRGSSVYLVPREDGELVVGATQEELGVDTRVTAGGLWELLRDAQTLVPGITELEFTEAVARLRPGTPDNGPILGPAAGPDGGLVLATGHFRNGVLLTPITADVIVSYLVSGELPDMASHFTMERFGGPVNFGGAS